MLTFSQDPFLYKETHTSPHIHTPHSASSTPRPQRQNPPLQHYALKSYKSKNKKWLAPPPPLPLSSHPVAPQDMGRHFQPPTGTSRSVPPQLLPPQTTSSLPSHSATDAYIRLRQQSMATYLDTHINHVLEHGSTTPPTVPSHEPNPMERFRYVEGRQDGASVVALGEGVGMLNISVCE